MSVTPSSAQSSANAEGHAVKSMHKASKSDIDFMIGGPRGNNLPIEKFEVGCLDNNFPKKLAVAFVSAVASKVNLDTLDEIVHLLY